MCGFTGKIWRDPERPADIESAARMAAVLAHRGPDEARTLAVREAAFGFQRLAVIDVEGGHQPLQNEDGRYTLVFNGEIYNYRQLRADLQDRGHRFTTRSDAEVVVHLFEEMGDRCVDSLEGMFAFAVWDRHERKLFLAADRTGKKPLYYTVTRDAWLFASELKALLQDPAVERQLDPVALAHYLKWQYVSAPRTIFKLIAKVEPATVVSMDLSDGMKNGIAWLNYWSLQYEPKAPIAAADAESQARDHLERAVARRLESEVPLGILLSGGIDSSSVVAMARRHVTGPLRTFSIGFDEASHNELPYARQVAERYETEHEEFIVRPEAMSLLPKIAWHADEPFGDPSAIPTFLLAEMTRRHVTVALGGDGGDESFAGYHRYRTHPAVSAFSKFPRALRERAIRPMTRVARGAWQGSAYLIKLQWLNDVSLYDPDQLYAAHLTIFPPMFLETIWAGERDILNAPLTERIIRAMRETDAVDPLDRKMACDVVTYLPGDLLTKVDRMTMAHGLEVRSPFLDRELMEFAARLPADIKFPGGELKGLLKSAMAPLLPDNLLKRPKQGFSVPLAAWFRGTLRNLPEAMLLSDRARSRGIFRPEGVKMLIDQHRRGTFNHAHRLWVLIMFEAWAQTFLDPAVPPAGPIDGFDI